jgi:predicted ATP-dependent endonuclease of OLD family
MKLIAFKAEHFRCLFTTEWIPFTELSIFTGENDGGKSSTLYALQIFLDSRSQPQADDYAYLDTSAGANIADSREDEIILQAKFALRDSESALLKSVWDIDSNEIVVRRIFKVASATSPFEIEALSHADNAFATPLDDYTVKELQDVAKRFEISITGATRKQEYVDTIRSWLRSQSKVSAFVKLPDGLVAALPQIQIFSSETALDPEKEIRKTLSTQFQALIDSDRYSGTISQIKKDIEADLNVQLEKLAPFVK